MATTLAPPKLTLPPKTRGGGQGGGKGFGGSGGSGDGWASAPWFVPARAYHTGMWIGIAGIVMIFAAFTSALVVRRGLATDWVPTALPHILFLNTLVLVFSSLTLELSRRSLRARRGAEFARWLYLTAALGLAFRLKTSLPSQRSAWRSRSLPSIGTLWTASGFTF